MTGTFDFTSQELATLTVIANLCPFVEGNAVYEAQVILHLSDPTLQFENLPCGLPAPPVQKVSIENHEDFKVSPNPASGLVQITLAKLKDYDNVEITISDILGNVLKTKKITNESETYFDITSLDSGVYYCSLKQGEKLSRTRKLIVVK